MAQDIPMRNPALRFAATFPTILIICGLAQGQSVTTYHAAANRSGHYVMPTFTRTAAPGTHLDTKFAGTVIGNIYAQPLSWKDALGNRSLIVATESNNVYALNATTGKVVWQTSLGTPVALSSLPCGNINPLGVTGTPVIDATRAAVYLDAMIQDSTGPQHYVFGLSLADGSILSGFPVNVADALTAAGYGFSPVYQNQRGALVIVGSTLFIPYGAHYGDCGTFHGWVVGMNLTAPNTVVAWSSDATGAGVWATNGISYDGSSLFVGTGNTFAPGNWSDGEAVIRFGTTLSPPTSTKNYFAASNWSSLDGADVDLGSSGAVPISVTDTIGTARYVLALGKDGNAYLLNRANLGGIGGSALKQEVSSGSIMTAPAVWTGTDSTLVAFQGAGVNCPAGESGDLTALMITAHPTAVSTAWCSPLHGAGAPIVTTLKDGSNSIVWITGAEGDNLLHGYDGDTGVSLFSGGAMVGLRHFGTILAANGRLYVAADNRIYSFLP